MYRVEITDDMCTHTRTHTQAQQPLAVLTKDGSFICCCILAPAPLRGRYKLGQTDYISQISSLHCVLIVPVQ